MRVAVVGAGAGGLAAAHRLTKLGHDCDVYERWPGLGGQAATLAVGPGRLIERYYHHLFRSDRAMRELVDELGIGEELEWLPSSMAMFVDGATHPFTTPADLLRYSPLSLRARARMGLTVLALQRRPGRVEDVEGMTARAWISRRMGREVWERFWGPLLRGKFGDRADSVSMAWLWSKLLLRRELRGEERRTELLGYPRGSWEVLWGRLAELIEERGGRVMIDRPIARIARDADGFELTVGAPDSFRRGVDPRRYETLPGTRRYDAVIATVPNDVFEQLLDPRLASALAPGYLERLAAIEYYAVACLLLEVSRPLTTHYWTNVIDPTVPFVGTVEQTNLVDLDRYGGRRFVYVPNYVPRDDPLLELDADALLAHYDAGLRRLNPSYTREWVRERWLFREAHAQPIVTPGHRDRIPPIETGVAGLLLINTTQIYPQDRGTNYGVAQAERAVGLLLGA